MNRPNILVVDGPDGCGKTSIVNRLAEKIAADGIKVKTAREPGGTPLGEDLRGIIKKIYASGPKSALTELLLFMASRSALLEQIRTEKDTLYVLDRHNLSTLVYQGILGGECSATRQLIEIVSDPEDYIGTIIVLAPKGKVLEYKGIRAGQDEPCEQEDKYGYRTDELVHAYLDNRDDDGRSYVLVNDGELEDAVDSAYLKTIEWLKRESWT